MPRHALFIPDLPLEFGADLTLTGDEARHAARVKRVAVGDTVAVHDGAGTVASAEVVGVGREVAVMVRRVEHVEPTRPAVGVWSATPKGARLADMIDSLAQVGAESWTPMRTERAGVDPAGVRRDRLERVAAEALKQCRRAWIMRIESARTFQDAILINSARAGEVGGTGEVSSGTGVSPVREQPDAHGRDARATSNLGSDARATSDLGSEICATMKNDVTALVLADAAGEPYQPTGASRVRLLIGPEGGFSEREIDAARAAGARVHCFGVHTMRVELAAPVACAIIIDRERPGA